MPPGFNADVLEQKSHPHCQLTPTQVQTWPRQHLLRREAGLKCCLFGGGWHPALAFAAHGHGSCGFLLVLSLQVHAPGDNTLYPSGSSPDLPCCYICKVNICTPLFHSECPTPRLPNAGILNQCQRKGPLISPYWSALLDPGLPSPLQYAAA